MKIVFPEYENPIIKAATKEVAQSDPNFEAICASSIEEACALCKNGSADAIIAGIDCPTRDVVLACRDHLGATGETFSSCFVLNRPATLKATLEAANLPANTPMLNAPDTLILADAGVTKNPTPDQLFDIVLQTYETALRVLDDEPRLAMLSFSSFGSAKDESIDKITSVIERVHSTRPEIKIDGEMQLDCAINPVVAAKKAPVALTADGSGASCTASSVADSSDTNSAASVAGHANVLIVPDLNSGNILYKSLEQFGGYIAAGPILQGFIKPVSDLSRGSTTEDVKLVITTLKKLG